MYEDPTLFPRLIDCVLEEGGADVLAFNLRAHVPKPGGWAPNRQFGCIINEKLAAGTDKLVLSVAPIRECGLDSLADGALHVCA